jgi:hypothetical protein
MKKKTNWKTLAALALAAATWLKLAGDFPGEPPFKPTCRDDERLDWDPEVRRWVCVRIVDIVR